MSNTMLNLLRRNTEPPSHKEHFDSCWRIITYFATNMILLKKFKNAVLEEKKGKKNNMQISGIELSANPLVQPYSLTEKAAVSMATIEKTDQSFSHRNYFL